MDALGTLLGVDMTSQQSLDPNASEKKAAPPSAAAAPNAPKGDEAKSGADGSKQVHKNAGVERKEEIQKPLTDLQKKVVELGRMELGVLLKILSMNLKHIFATTQDNSPFSVSASLPVVHLFFGSSPSGLIR